MFCCCQSQNYQAPCVDSEGGTGGPDPHLENDKNVGFLSNTGPDPLKNHKAFKSAFNVLCWAIIGPPVKRFVGPLLMQMVFGSSLPPPPPPPKKKKKKVILFGHFNALYGRHSQSKNGLYFPNFMYFSTYFPIFYDIFSQICSKR